jgi:hypothetical protein
VTLYFAYAEYELGLLLADLGPLEPFSDERRQWQVGRKLVQAQRLLGNLRSETLDELLGKFVEARSLFERRNMLVHSCIFTGSRVVSSRPGIPEGCTSPGEHDELAEQISSWKEHIHAYRFKKVRPLLASIGKPRTA